MTEFGIYIHWPFCRSKCPYCDFNSHVPESMPDQQIWADAYRRELDALAHRANGAQVNSVYFGGGTPSLMAAETVAAILERITHHWPLAENVEITIEANPTSSEAALFHNFVHAGINRLSLGIQALNDKDLALLGREHSAAEALSALELARQTFSRVSFDLIYARPGQQINEWKMELQQALELAAGHLSLYQLSIEKGTQFWRERIKPPQENLARDFFDLTQDMCADAGLLPYEISNFAIPGNESRHNLLYWRYGDYLGIGPGAHSRLAGHALSTHADPARWLASVQKNGYGLQRDEKLTHLEQAEEMLLMGLRLTEGLDLEALHKKTGYSITPLDDDGLTIRKDNRLIVMPEGRPVLDSLIFSSCAKLAAS